MLTSLADLRMLRIQASLTSFPDALCLMHLPHLADLELQVFLAVANSNDADSECTLFGHATANYFEEVSSRRRGHSRVSQGGSLLNPVVEPASPPTTAAT